MFLQSLSSFWGFAQAVADHLWQSTLFVAAAGLLNPLIAGAAMAFSSFFVVSNSLRLRNFGATRGDAVARS